MRADARRIGGALAIVTLVGCGSPTAPETTPLVLALSGQSNAHGLRPLLAGHATVISDGYMSQPIDCWDDGNPCWELFVADIQHYHGPAPQAFVWWQGEQDQYLDDASLPHLIPEPSGFYAAHLTVLFSRIRARWPGIPIIAIELGPANRGRTVTIETLTVMARVQAIYLNTEDLEFPDGWHLTAAGYETLAVRILHALGR